MEGVKQNAGKIAYSVAETSEETSLSKSYIRNEIRDGHLKARKIGRRILILSEDLREYLDKNTV